MIYYDCQLSRAQSSVTQYNTPILFTILLLSRLLARLLSWNLIKKERKEALEYNGNW